MSLGWVSIDIDADDVLSNLSIEDVIEYYGIDTILREIDDETICEYVEKLGFELVEKL